MIRSMNRLALATAALAASLVGAAGSVAAADEPPQVAKKVAAPKLTSQELADWIDRRFGEEYKAKGATPAELVDDATFLRRAFLDLQGRIPTVAQLRDFESEAGSFKRQDLVDRLVTDNKQPDRFAQRSADNLARVWRRMMIPASSPGAAMGPQLDPWLARQFQANTSYDQIARKLLLVQPPQQPMLPPTPSEQPAAPPDPDAAAIAFQQAVGQSPDMLASAYVRVFLGVRINCAQCHDHPMADWKKSDFWGVAAMFNGVPSPKDMPGAAPTIKPQDEEVQYVAKLLWESEPLKEIPAEKSPREVLADWLVSPENPNFAATAVNRVWQYLCGRGLAGAVDELDRVTVEERKVLDELAELFKASGHDLRWLITGISKSKVYQQQVVRDASDEDAGFVHRPLKTLLPEQVFDSLEQALSLPVARADNGPRFNGEREQFVSRMNESATDLPADFKGGIPQALMLMNGKLTADATSLDSSRTLRAVVEAPFFSPEQKIEVLYLAALTRKPRAEELQFLLDHVRQFKTEAEQKTAYSQIMWGLLNNPEFVLSR
jgi:mono/diheme cytochrome c family protein